ncbi:hypothetical protein CTI12_AA310880 (mitochondrion) [Artemisia annua]|uniref:ATPase F1/V1/A1 complex alpha/beta subunit N-terminal domain-containing protein n=1 Tax=Artemisia annua TaxID=35608 RepID=A0A2U1N446_ARTAN|nr:hypothetical protein CTI12_AA310880 [Artemisia annua]
MVGKLRLSTFRLLMDRVGIALNLESTNVGVVLMGDGLLIQEGSSVKATGSDQALPPQKRRPKNRQVVEDTSEEEAGGLLAAGKAPSCRNGVGRQRLLPRGQLGGAEVRRRAFWLLSYSSTQQHPTAPVLLSLSMPQMRVPLSSEGVELYTRLCTGLRGLDPSLTPGASACYLRIAPWISSEMFDASWGFFGDREKKGPCREAFPLSLDPEETCQIKALVIPASRDPRGSLGKAAIPYLLT